MSDRPAPAPSEPDLRGRIVLITGANAGIGLATARALAARGATLLLVSRSRERGEGARRRIVEATGNEGVELLLADLASQRQVRELAAEVLRRHEPLHVLINNAAIYTRRRERTEDGVEMQLAVNHLAPFLLTTLLLDRLTESAPARVVTVSSEAHRRVRMRWDDLQGERRYGALRAYAQSKLANLLFTRELARRTAGTRVTANALHPGVVATELLFGGWGPLRLLRRWLKTPEQGAETSVYLASSPRVEGVSGYYFRDCRAIEPSRQAQDDAVARRLWEVSEELTRQSA